MKKFKREIKRGKVKYLVELKWKLIKKKEYERAEERWLSFSYESFRWNLRAKDTE